jgi:4-amino-4-deoxy-L-arabinose transferase-like glycosyltransferase
MERAIKFAATFALFWAGLALLRSQPLVGAAAMMAAVAAFVLLPRALPRPIATSAAARATASPRGETLGQRISRSAGALWLIGASIVCGALAPLVDANPSLQPWPALIIWATAIALLLAGAWRLAPPRMAGTRPRGTLRWLAQWLPRERAQVLELAAVLAITLLAFGLRVYSIAIIPWNFGGDEGEMGMFARNVLQGNVRDPFATGWLSHPNLWFFLQALSLRMFGNTIFGLRLLSALIGTATVPALYVFARPLYGRPTALLATLLLATYHFHIHFSRLGVNNIVDPLAALVAFTAFLYGMRRGSALSFALAGVALGLAQHFYMGSRLAPIVVAAALLHQLVLNRARVWELRWQIGLMALGFVLGFGPLLNYFATHPRDFSARLGMVGIFQTSWFEQRRASGVDTIEILLDQARNGFGAWTWQPDRSAWYDPKIPLLDQVSAVLFLLGLGVAISNWRRIDAALLLAWIVGTAVFGGMLLINAPESPRYVTSAPAVCLLIAFALELPAVLLGRAVGYFASRRARTPGTSIETDGSTAAAEPVAGPSAGHIRRVLVSAGWAVASITAVLMAAWNVNFYFREYTPRNTYGWYNTDVSTTIGQYLALQRDPVFVFFVGSPVMYYGNASIRFQAPDVPGVDVLDPIASSDAVPAPPEGQRPIFIFLPHRTGELALVEARYPGGSTQHVMGRNGEEMMTLYEPAP